MHCAGCVSNIEKALKGVDGVTIADVNLVTERARVEAVRDEIGGNVFGLVTGIPVMRLAWNDRRPHPSIHSVSRRCEKLE